MPIPHPNITPISDNEPDAIPALWNDRYSEINANFTNHEERVVNLETLDYAVATGAVNVYAVALPVPIVAHVPGMPITFKANLANTGSCTVNVDGIGAIPIKDPAGNNPVSGSIAAGAIVVVVYDGTNYVITSATSNVTGSSGSCTGNSETATDADKLDGQHGSFYTVPAGTVIHVAMNTAPTGYLKANGSAVSRTTYAALFTAIGTVFGAGNGSTTFNLPDLRGEFIRSWADNGSVDSGRAFGSSQADDLESHAHTVDGASSVGSLAGVWAYEEKGASIASTDANTTKATGGTETRPRNIALLACIKC